MWTYTAIVDLRLLNKFWNYCANACVLVPASFPSLIFLADNSIPGPSIRCNGICLFVVGVTSKQSWQLSKVSCRWSHRPESRQSLWCTWHWERLIPLHLAGLPTASFRCYPPAYIDEWMDGWIRESAFASCVFINELEAEPVLWCFWYFS